MNCPRAQTHLNPCLVFLSEVAKLEEPCIQDMQSNLKLHKLEVYIKSGFRWSGLVSIFNTPNASSRFIAPLHRRTLKELTGQLCLCCKMHITFLGANTMAVFDRMRNVYICRALCVVINNINLFNVMTRALEILCHVGLF
jgi:hypothetical protein